MHTHFLPLAWPDYSAKYGDASGPWPWMRPNEGGDPSRAMLMLGKEEFRPVHHACWDIAKRYGEGASPSLHPPGFTVAVAANITTTAITSQPINRP